MPGRTLWSTGDPSGPSLSQVWAVPTIHAGTASGAHCGLSQGCRKPSCRAEVSLPRRARVAGAALRPQQGGGKVLFPFMHPLVKVAKGKLVSGQEGDSMESRVYLFIFKKLVTLTSVPQDCGLPGSSLLTAAIQAILFVGKGGREEKCCREHLYP